MGTHEERGVARQWFDVADAAPVLLDAQGRVTGWTREAQRLLAYEADEAVGRNVAELLSAEDAARVPEVMERCRADGGWVGLLTGLRGDGRAAGIMVRITAALDTESPSRWLALLSELDEAPGWDMSRAVLEQMVARSPSG